MAGINMQMLARGQLAWELTGDVFLVALVSSGFAPPILLFSLFGGTLADRWNRRRMIQYSQLVVSLVAGIVGVTIVTGVVNIWILFGAALTQGFCWSFMMPARQAIIPQLVGEREITNAIALNASGMALMTLSGPGLGGLAYSAFGPATHLFCDGSPDVCGVRVDDDRQGGGRTGGARRKREKICSVRFGMGSNTRMAIQLSSCCCY